METASICSARPVSNPLLSHLVRRPIKTLYSVHKLTTLFFFYSHRYEQELHPLPKPLGDITIRRWVWSCSCTGEASRSTILLHYGARISLKKEMQPLCGRFKLLPHIFCNNTTTPQLLCELWVEARHLCGPPTVSSITNIPKQPGPIELDQAPKFLAELLGSRKSDKRIFQMFPFWCGL
jgi:hypothetical protein